MNNLSHSRRLRDKIQLARGEMDAAAKALWTHPRLREIYPEFLFRNHSVIRSSVPLMQAAAAACEKRLDSDPLAEGGDMRTTHSSLCWMFFAVGSVACSHAAPREAEPSSVPPGWSRCLLPCQFQTTANRSPRRSEPP